MPPPDRGPRAGHAAITAPCPSLARPPTLWRPCAGTSILAAMPAMDPSPQELGPHGTIWPSLRYPVLLKAEEQLILDAILPPVGVGAGSILLLGCRCLSDEEGNGDE